MPPRPSITVGVAVGFLALLSIAAVAVWQALGWWTLIPLVTIFAVLIFRTRLFPR